MADENTTTNAPIPPSTRETPKAETKTVKVRSMMRVIHTVAVPCREDCNGEDCLCTVQTFRSAVDDGNGNRGVREEERRIPGSITFLAGETQDVPAWFVDSPAFKSEVARKTLRLVKEENKPKAKSGNSGPTPKA